MVLQADVAPARPVAERVLELILAAVRILAGDAPPVHVHLRDRVAVEPNRDPAALTGNHGRVPLAGRADGLLAGGDEIVDGAAVVRPTHLAAVGVEDLDLDAGVDG